MLTSTALLAPASPTLLIDEQRGDITEMIEALQAAGRRLAAEEPVAIVLLSARWSSGGSFQVDDARQHRSVIDLPGFGVEPRHDGPGHPALARAILARAGRDGVRAATARHGMDTGASIPMHFLARGGRIRVVPVSVGAGTREEHRAWGASIRGALVDWPERVAFVAGGSLSWHLHAFNLRRDPAECRELDAAVLAALKRGEWGALAGIVARLGERAMPEAGLLHLEVLHGLLASTAVRGEVCEVESASGIGSALVEFPTGAVDTPA